jgi:hypothetical protein
MATVKRLFLSTVGNLPPGGSQGWWMVGFKYGDAMSVTAHPVTGNPSLSTGCSRSKTPVSMVHPAAR